jgi:alkylhydroperoxidase family enzyme
MGAEVVAMAMTSLDLDPEKLRLLRYVTGATSNREAVDWAIDMAIGVERQREALRRIRSHDFAPDHFDNPPPLSEDPPS